MDITAFAKPIFRIDVPAAGVISCRTCTVITYRRLKCGTFTAEDISGIIIGDLPPFLHSTLTIFIRKYIAELDKYRKDNCDILQVPDDGSEPEKKCRLGVSTFYDHCVKDYSGLNFAEINELNIIDYWLLLADSVKLMALQNKKDPEEYLNGCWCYMHDKATPDGVITEITIE